MLPGLRELRAGERLERHAVELLHEVEVPEITPQLTVGDRLQADRFLARDHRADRGVLGGAQRGRIDLAAAELLAGAAQGGGAQQAPHVVGTERWFHGRQLPRAQLRTIPKGDAGHGRSQAPCDTGWYLLYSARRLASG